MAAKSWADNANNFFSALLAPRISRDHIFPAVSFCVMHDELIKRLLISERVMLLLPVQLINIHCKADLNFKTPTHDFILVRLAQLRVQTTSLHFDQCLYHHFHAPRKKGHSEKQQLEMFSKKRDFCLLFRLNFERSQLES